jgi:hypothetical protein
MLYPINKYWSVTHKRAHYELNITHTSHGYYMVVWVFLPSYYTQSNVLPLFKMCGKRLSSGLHSTPKRAWKRTVWCETRQACFITTVNKISSTGMCPHYNMGSMEKQGITEFHNMGPFARILSFFNRGLSCISQFTHSLLTKNGFLWAQ